jgi:hypothetical protein
VLSVGAIAISSAAVLEFQDLSWLPVRKTDDPLPAIVARRQALHDDVRVITRTNGRWCYCQHGER